MEFREYKNPEGKDYDIASSLTDSDKSISTYNRYSSELIDLIGILEDFEESDLISMYGITLDEYLNPTQETINKVISRLDEIDSRRGR